MAFEDALANRMFSGGSDKTFIDKVLGKEDSERIRELIKSPRLKREDILEILYLMANLEAKLVNYNEYERYVMLKFFIWIREFVKNLELFFDYTDNLTKKELTCVKCNKEYDPSKPDSKCSCFVPILKISDSSKRLLDNISLNMEHMVKFMVDLYMNISRTSMSIKAKGFEELMHSKFELQYYQKNNLDTPDAKKGFLERNLGR